MRKEACSQVWLESKGKNWADFSLKWITCWNDSQVTQQYQFFATDLTSDLHLNYLVSKDWKINGIRFSLFSSRIYGFFQPDKPHKAEDSTNYAKDSNAEHNFFNNAVDVLAALPTIFPLSVCFRHILKYFSQYSN